MLRQRFRRPRAEGVDDGVEPGQIILREGEQVLFQHRLGVGLVGVADDGRHIQALPQGFFDNPLTGFPVGTDNCNFHHGFLLQIELMGL